MTLLPEAHDLPPPVASRSRTAKATETRWNQLIAAMTDPELTVIVISCTIALLITINLILRFPNFGAVIEQYNQF